MSHIIKTTLLSFFFIFNFLFAQEGSIAMHGIEKSQNKQIYYGKILEIKPAMSYKYLKIDENGTTIWVAIANAPVVVGNTIGYDKKTMMTDFKSKSLDQEFKEIYFASDVYLPQKSKQAQTMKGMLGLSSQEKSPNTSIKVGMNPKEAVKTIALPFVKKERYTVEELHMWRNDLKDQNITLEGTVSKVSHAIMKRDWIHIGDGTGSEKSFNNDLVFTAISSSLKSGDKVVAKGTVIIDKDFGFGYFYKVIIENASFKVK